MEGNCMKLKEKVFKGVDNYYYALQRDIARASMILLC